MILEPQPRDGGAPEVDQWAANSRKRVQHSGPNGERRLSSSSLREGFAQEYDPRNIDIGKASYAEVLGGNRRQLTRQLPENMNKVSAQSSGGINVVVEPNYDTLQSREQSYALKTSSQHASSPGSTYQLRNQVEPNMTANARHSRELSTEALAEQCGWQIGRNKFLWNAELPTSNLIATKRGFLGKGIVGIVDEVTVSGFRQAIARKRFVLSRSKRSAARDRKDIQSEIDILKSLDHDHIVKILGCYEEQWGRTPSVCALMLPAGDEDLDHFLYEECQALSDEQKSWIGSWFGCLASALAYMHSQNVHHEDIKPSNIVHRGHKIYFTDFSSSRRLEAGQDTSTESPARASRLFAAPEAMSEDGKISRHGSKTDVYSLGLVFVEMLAVLSHRDVSEMRDFLFRGHQSRTKRYCHVIERIPSFLGPSCDKAWEDCLGKMLHPLRTSRPSARDVVDTLQVIRVVSSDTTCSCQKKRHARTPIDLRLISGLPLEQNITLSYSSRRDENCGVQSWPWPKVADAAGTMAGSSSPSIVSRRSNSVPSTPLQRARLFLAHSRSPSPMGEV